MEWFNIAEGTLRMFTRKQERGRGTRNMRRRAPGVDAMQRANKREDRVAHLSSIRARTLSGLRCIRRVVQLTVRRSSELRCDVVDADVDVSTREELQAEGAEKSEDNRRTTNKQWRGAPSDYSSITIDLIKGLNNQALKEAKSLGLRKPHKPGSYHY